MTPVFFSGATYPFGLLKLFWKPLVGLCGMLMQCTCNRLLVVIDMYGSVFFFIAWLCCSRLNGTAIVETSCD